MEPLALVWVLERVKVLAAQYNILQTLRQLMI
jgi:hypothetical protein